jgi:hypothetical protein
LGTNPKFRTLPVNVKVFGIGNPNVDTVKTSAPELVLVKAGVNVMAEPPWICGIPMAGTALSAT